MDCWYIVITVIAWILAITMILGEKDDQLLLLCRLYNYVGLVLVYANTRMDTTAKDGISSIFNFNTSNRYFFNL